MKKNHKLNLRKGFTLIELLVVITVIAILAGIAVPATTTVLRNARTTKDTSNLRNISVALIAYGGDEGSYPTGADANVAFAELFNEGYLDNAGEALFAVANVTTVDPDGDISTAATILPAGSNGYDYIEGISTSGASGSAIAMDTRAGGTATNFNEDLRGKKALVATLSGAVVKATIDTVTTLDADGIDYTDLTDDVYGDVAAGDLTLRSATGTLK